LKFQGENKQKEKKERRFWRFAVARSEGGLKKKVKITRFIYLLFIV
jgi:hypothetical protein